MTGALGVNGKDAGSLVSMLHERGCCGYETTLGLPCMPAADICRSALRNPGATNVVHPDFCSHCFAAGYDARAVDHVRTSAKRRVLCRRVQGSPQVKHVCRVLRPVGISTSSPPQC